MEVNDRLLASGNTPSLNNHILLKICGFTLSEIDWKTIVSWLCSLIYNLFICREEMNLKDGNLNDIKTVKQEAIHLNAGGSVILKPWNKLWIVKLGRGVNVNMHAAGYFHVSSLLAPSMAARSATIFHCRYQHQVCLGAVFRNSPWDGLPYG